MPRAPQIPQQIQPAALPGVRVSAAGTPESYGANVGQTAARIGAAIYDREVYAADHAAVLDAETKAGDAQLQIIQQMSQMRGKDAAQAPDYAAQTFDKATADIQKGLSNDRQRGLFAGLMRTKRDSLNRLALSHFNQENERFLEHTFNANMSQSVNMARANADSPLQVADEKDLQAMKIRERAQRLGYNGTPQEQDEITAMHSRTNTEVIRGLLSNDEDLKAKAYYDAMLKQEKAHPGGGLLNFTAQDRDAVQRAVEEGSTRGTAQRLLRGWLASGKTEGEMYAEADKQDNPKITDLAHSLVSRHFREQAAIKKEQGDNDYLQATNLVDQAYKQNPDGAIEPRMLIAPDKWATFSIGERNALEARAKALTRYEKPDRPNDDKLWLDFLALKPEEVANLSR